MELRGRPLELLTRAVAALEKLAEEPVIEIETGPPICPECGVLNPEVEIAEHDKVGGPLIELVVGATCQCGAELFVVPLDLAIFTSEAEALLEVNRRAGIVHGNGSN